VSFLHAPVSILTCTVIYRCPFLFPSYLVKILLLRGETSIRILDVALPNAELLENKAVSFIQTDITSRSSVEAGLLAPFASTCKPPSVIFHCAANIRFWERASYTYQESYRVNVQGTQNVVDVARMLPEPALLIYTSSSDVVLPRPHFMKLGKDYGQQPYNTVIFSDADPPLGENEASSSCYARSKIEAEQLVLEANEPHLRTASLRPGQYVRPSDSLHLTAYRALSELSQAQTTA
jgi:nucleoside-diphosphate-sugar epimerase